MILRRLLRHFFICLVRFGPGVLTPGFLIIIWKKHQKMLVNIIIYDYICFEFNTKQQW
jgi:hypothetical protein